MLFGTWLQGARARERADGVDHHRLACYASELTSYVQTEIGHAVRILELTYTQLPPVPLDEERQRQLWETRRDKTVRDLRVAVDHLGAVLAALGCTDEEFENALNPVSDNQSVTVKKDVASLAEKQLAVPRPKTMDSVTEAQK